MCASPPLQVMVCVGERCDARGVARKKLSEIDCALTKRFGGERASGRIKITPRDCLRLCTTEPVIRLEPSGEVFAGIAADALLIEIEKTLGEEI